MEIWIGLGGLVAMLIAALIIIQWDKKNINKIDK